MTDRAQIDGWQHVQSGEHTEPTCPPNARSHETIHRFRVRPVDVGIDGFVDGGTLLEWIDKAAYATAVQWCGRSLRRRLRRQHSP